ncbi:MAG: hypothetical protein ACT4PX_06765 [Actinomycetota bacterium]
MPSAAGGVGLGLVFGWLTAAAPLPAGPGRAGALLAALSALAAEAALLGDGAAAAWCVAAMVAGAALRLAVAAAARKGVGA